ncbi:MAG: diguanylate cyclase [Ruminococcaceae bacterium]|nr:diguanylate cyclase [Oscillospiraceae bacterium]
MISRLKDTLLLIGSASSDRPRLREIFQASFDLLEAENIHQARMLLEQNGGCIAAVLADLPLTNTDDLRTLATCCHQGSPNEIPIILFVTPTGAGEQEELAFALGATDVVLRPYTPTIALRRVQVIIDLFLHKWHLEKLVDEQSRTIRNTNQIMLDALSAIIEHRSTESGNHVLRIRRFTEILLEEVAAFCPEYGLNENSIGIIASAAALHDIGKISIPDSILNKPGRLTQEEFDIIRTHTTIGGRLVENLSGMGDPEYLRYAYNIALYHHERWDGKGYPCGLKDNEIPICAQVVGLADAFDALTSHRVYKPMLPYDQAFNMIVNGECGVFSPRLLECFKHVRPQFVELAHQYADGYSPKSDHITMPLPAPEWKRHALDSLQLSQVKYQALLHYLDATVLELDLDHDLYHVVYNPNPDLDSITPTASFSQIIAQLQSSNVHPEDVGVADEIRRCLTEDFFRLNLRRCVFPCRIFSPTLGTYQTYELIFLRVNTGNADQRIVIAIWNKLEQALSGHEALLQTALLSSPALYGLVSTALRCRSDGDLTIDAGAKDLFSLTGYNSEELEKLFHSKLLNLVYPADRPAFSAAMQKHMQNGGRADTEFRLQRKNAEPLWVLARSRVYTEADGQEYVYHAIRDNSQIRQTINLLQADAERHDILTDQSEGVIFTLDLNTDTLSCSSRWQEIFGYPPKSEHFLSQLHQTSHFHPDDLSLILSWVEDLRLGKESQPHLEVRIVNREGKYIWCRIRARLQRDGARETNRIVGIIYDVDEFKRATIALKEQAQRDSLTKLLNKASTQNLITEHLSSQDGQRLSAMLILDMDNFKSVNDRYGHLFGDAILSQVSSRLRSLFRSHDILGRIGGDEFLILLKDVPNIEIVESRCSLLLENFHNLLNQLMPDLDVSFSIGAALAPLHATTYADLFKHADEALYIAKSNGKNCYKIYDPHDKYNSLLENATYINTRIDSDDEPNIAGNSFIRFVFNALYESRDLEATVNELLAHIGMQFNVSRAYIFENNDDNTTCSNTFEWCNEGVHPEIKNLQNISYEADIPGWREAFDENNLIYCSDISQLTPPLRAILEPQGIKSMLHCAIQDNDVFRGYIGFDDCTANRLWTQEQISLLQFLSEVMALFLLKKRTQDKAMAQAANLKNILDCQDAWLYVVNPNTYQLKFLNAKLKKLAPRSQTNQLCYKTLLGRKRPCVQCPLHSSGGISTIRNEKLDVVVQAHADPILWDGKEECLITCHELAEE